MNEPEPRPSTAPRRFETAAPPHAIPTRSVPAIMRRVLYALIPAAAAYTWFFGIGLVINFAIAAPAALATEAAILSLRRRPVRRALRDGSALVTAALLAFALPPLLPWWIPALGGFVAIAAKQLYGGLGKNPFNPAMVAYALLLLSFPIHMTQWLPPRMGDIDYTPLTAIEQVRYSLFDELPPKRTVDAYTRATPLDAVKEGLREQRSFQEMSATSLIGTFGGLGWEWVSSFVAFGGLYLLYAGIIRWQIPVATLTGLAVPAMLLHMVDPERFASAAFHVFSGAAMLGAFFIATDPVSASTTDRGRLIFGAGVGLLTYAIRTWGGYPDGVAFAVLLMNAAVPLIDRFTRPRIHGHAER